MNSRSCSNGRSCFDLGGDRSYCIDSRISTYDGNISRYDSSCMDERLSSLYDQAVRGEATPCFSSTVGQGHAPTPLNFTRFFTDSAQVKALETAAVKLNQSCDHFELSNKDLTSTVNSLKMTTESLKTETAFLSRDIKALQTVIEAKAQRIKQVFENKRQSIFDVATNTAPVMKDIQANNPALYEHLLSKNETVVATQKEEANSTCSANEDSYWSKVGKEFLCQFAKEAMGPAASTICTCMEINRMDPGQKASDEEIRQILLEQSLRLL